MKNNFKIFSEAHQSLAAFAGALAHPARIAIIQILQASGQASCGDLVRALPLAQATVSQHLRCLRGVGLLKAEECGPSVCYSIDEERLRSFCHSFQCTLGTAKSIPELETSSAESSKF